MLRYFYKCSLTISIFAIHDLSNFIVDRNDIKSVVCKNIPLIYKIYILITLWDYKVRMA